MVTKFSLLQTRRCYQQNRLKIPLTNKLYLIINTIQFTSRDQNNLIIMNGLPNVHKQNFTLRPVVEAFFQHSFVQPCKISAFHSLPSHS